MKRPKSRPNKSKLLTQVERSSENTGLGQRNFPEFDAKDSDPVSYVEDFLKEQLNLGPMEEISLLTPEKAREALTIIEKRYRLVQERLRTSHALRKMLESYEPPPVDSEQH